jgi:hypothetical protein
LSKNSDFNHLKIIFAQKTQKSQNKIKKISKSKNQGNMWGHVWRQIKPQKAMWQHKDELYWIKEQSGQVWLLLSMCKKGGAPLLREVAHPMCSSS